METVSCARACSRPWDARASCGDVQARAASPDTTGRRRPFARSLSHIDNVLQGCRLASPHPGAAGQTYYITDRQTYTTKQIFEAMAIALGVVPRFIRLPRLTGQMAHALDLALASTGLYWQTLHVAGESDWHVGASWRRRAAGWIHPRIDWGSELASSRVVPLKRTDRQSAMKG